MIFDRTVRCGFPCRVIDSKFGIAPISGKICGKLLLSRSSELRVDNGKI